MIRVRAFFIADPKTREFLVGHGEDVRLVIGRQFYVGVEDVSLVAYQSDPELVSNAPDLTVQMRFEIEGDSGGPPINTVVGMIKGKLFEQFPQLRSISYEVSVREPSRVDEVSYKPINMT